MSTFSFDLPYGSPLVARLIRYANAGLVTIIATDILIDELAQTARKPRLAERVNPVVHDELISFLKDEADMVSLIPPFPACRDSKDAYLLALARDGRADFLVTNDQDLLSIHHQGDCEIVTPEVFHQRVIGRAN